MQDMYVGDIGDYGKYGLLRALFPTPCKLGIVWYLVPDEHHLNDGRHIHYLSKPEYIEYDRELFEILKHIIASGRRDIRQIEQSQILPAGTHYYSELLSCNTAAGGSLQNRLLRRSQRDQWLTKALDTMRDRDAVFLDPDNGLQTPSVPKHSAKAHKYIYYDEINKFLAQSNTLVVYHHLSRRGSHVSQIQQRVKELIDVAGKQYRVLSLRFKPYSPRAYFVITNQDAIKEKITKFANSSWNQCFERIS